MSGSNSFNRQISPPTNRYNSEFGRGGGGGGYSNNGYKRSREDYSTSSSMNHLAHSFNKEDNYNQATNYILDYYRQNAQTSSTYRKKIELRNALSNMLRELFPYFGLYIVGSSANGFGTEKSDVDMCLMISHEDIDQRSEAVQFLRTLGRALRKATFIKSLNVISAKVPIIKFHDAYNNLDCDLNINSHIGIRNTHLLKCYSEQDWRVKPLILMIKCWAKYHNINDAANRTISSYSLALMTIYYLQDVCSPPILPVLHNVCPEKFDRSNDIRSLVMSSESSHVFSSNNTQSLGELFGGFLYFYANFKFEYNIISVKRGRTLPKSQIDVADLLDAHSQHSQWKFILIEEPFDHSNTARSVYDYDTFKRIKFVFKESSRIFNATKNMKNLFKEPLYNPI